MRGEEKSEINESPTGLSFPDTRWARPRGPVRGQRNVKHRDTLFPCPSLALGELY